MTREQRKEIEAVLDETYEPSWDYSEHLRDCLAEIDRRGELIGRLAARLRLYAHPHTADMDSQDAIREADNMIRN